ncbi:MAG: hypothetical protein K6A36_04125, partial [Paludibacteraceae bacterium]|nr:hypothetical protein [Paludibacteraceae bacterium]
FSHLQSDCHLLLHDAETEQYIDIEENAAYTFYAVPNMLITDRFTIVDAAETTHSGDATSCDNLRTTTNVHKFIKDGQLFVLRDGLLYNAQGLVVR